MLQSILGKTLTDQLEGHLTTLASKSDGPTLLSTHITSVINA